MISIYNISFFLQTHVKTLRYKFSYHVHYILKLIEILTMYSFKKNFIYIYLYIYEYTRKWSLLSNIAWKWKNMNIFYITFRNSQITSRKLERSIHWTFSKGSLSREATCLSLRTNYTNSLKIWEIFQRFFSPQPLP